MENQSSKSPTLAFCTLTIEECEKHFKNFENNIDEFAQTKDKLSLLRCCIELLNRLEDTTYNYFAGRVLIFLAVVIPLFDQSGVNMRSEFNIKELPDKVIENLQKAAINCKTDKEIEHDMEEGETLSDDESNEASPQENSDRIYERFWKVQQFLYQPNLLYDKNTWFTFRTHVDTLVNRLENKPTNFKVWQPKSSYMTSTKSLSLQINDINMRRCLLVQILIVIQYLELPVDSKPETYVLDKVQMSWSSTITKRIFALLNRMPNLEEGEQFLSLVRRILNREVLWNKWKNDKCKEPQKREEEQGEEDEVISMRGTYHKRRKISDELSSAKPYNMYVIGSPEMSRLWNMKQVQKFSTPDLDKYLNISSEQQEECFKDPNYSFKLLRLLRRSPHFFGLSVAAIQSLDGYLKSAAERYLNDPNKTSKTS